MWTLLSFRINALSLNIPKLIIPAVFDDHEISAGLCKTQVKMLDFNIRVPSWNLTYFVFSMINSETKLRILLKQHKHYILSHGQP